MERVAAKTVYYRGLVRTCNYNCPYCPFGKKRRMDLQKDTKALEAFCAKVGQLGQVGVMFAPRGECLIYDHYQQAVAQISAYGNTDFVCCQTNLSFDVEKFSKTAGLGIEKLSLWCSFHPSQTTIDSFVGKCLALSRLGVNYCVGAVGNPGDTEVLEELRNKLPKEVYMWINAMDGLGRPYTADEIDAFSRIDPLFSISVEGFLSDPGLCRGGRDAIFVEGNGDFFACNISRAKLGNLYSADAFRTPAKTCISKKCDCYLAYSNRVEMDRVFLNRAALTTRAPSMEKAVFFDVDGTLADSTGTIPTENVQAVMELSQKCSVFIATSLPYQYARETCGSIWGLLSGGVFAEGSDVRIFDNGFKQIVPLGEDVQRKLPGHVEYVCYREDGVLHKITVTSGRVPDFEGCHIVRDDVTGIVSANAGKLNGVLLICKLLKLLSINVAIVGNGDNDLDMLNFFGNSYAVFGATDAAINAAKHICSIPGLAYGGLFQGNW